MYDRLGGNTQNRNTNISQNFKITCQEKNISKTSWGWAVPSSCQAGVNLAGLKPEILTE